MGTNADHFPKDATGLDEAKAPELVELADREEFDLRIAPVAKQIGEARQPVESSGRTTWSRSIG